MTTPDLPDITLYVNKRDGVTYKVVNDEVTEVFFSPSVGDEKLKCKTESAKPKKKRRSHKRSI